jgi:hypothetical protein
LTDLSHYYPLAASAGGFFGTNPEKTVNIVDATEINN